MEEKYAKNKFPIYYDSENSVAKALHQEFKILKLGRMPGILIIDKSGIIKFAYYGDSMHDIPKATTILSVLEELK
jgi:alkyl hydroperoxide reductase subunit AhpC